MPLEEGWFARLVLLSEEVLITKTLAKLRPLALWERNSIPKKDLSLEPEAGEEDKDWDDSEAKAMKKVKRLFSNMKN